MVTFVTPNITIMNTRLKQFLDAENISQSQFADTINVGRASISHVLSGRNNPSYDFVKAIMTAYPELNIEWLMLGKGKMYKNSQTEGSPAPAPQISRSLFDYEDLDTHIESTEQESEIPAQLSTNDDSAQISSDINTSIERVQVAIKQRSVSKIIIMYDDGTFQEM